jgi:hypothetical protein
MSEPFILTRKSVEAEIVNTPAEVLVTFYGIAVYHEKYRFAMWVLDELQRRGVDKTEIKKFDDNFQEFYGALLTQNDL